MSDQVTPKSETLLSTPADAGGAGADAGGAPAEGATGAGVAKPGESPQGTPGQDGTDAAGQADDGKTAPEAYQPFTLPEGVEVDAGLLETFGPVAKEAGLNQEAAQKLVDWFGGQVKAQQEQAQATAAQWVDTVKKDPEVGGPQLAERLAVAAKGLEWAAGAKAQEVRELLDATGLGNHPEFVRLFYRVGTAIAEDKPVIETPPGAWKKTTENVLYNHPTS
jgi:hypothetical protein